MVVGSRPISAAAVLLTGENPPVRIVHIGIELSGVTTLEPNLLKKSLLGAALAGPDCGRPNSLPPRPDRTIACQLRRPIHGWNLEQILIPAPANNRVQTSTTSVSGNTHSHRNQTEEYDRRKNSHSGRF
jgi:hypothetical protein